MNANQDYPIDWHEPPGPADQGRLIRCPACGSDCDKAPVLTTPSLADPQRARLVTFLRCAACSSLFAEDRVPFEYELALSPWADEYYLEQGACICRRSRSDPCSKSVAVLALPCILRGSSAAGSFAGSILRRWLQKDGGY
jgi:hypothetical protein